MLDVFPRREVVKLNAEVFVDKLLRAPHQLLPEVLSHALELKSSCHLQSIAGYDDDGG